MVGKISETCTEVIQCGQYLVVYLCSVEFGCTYVCTFIRTYGYYFVADILPSRKISLFHAMIARSYDRGINDLVST